MGGNACSCEAIRPLLAAVAVAIAFTLSPSPSLVNAGGEGGENSDAEFSESLRALGGPAKVHHKQWKKLVKMGVARYFRGHTLNAKLIGTTPLPALPPGGEGIKKIELAPLRNRQWSSAEFFMMGGVRTALSGQFSRARKAYFAIFPEGAAAPAFVGINDLIDGDAGILVNRVEYRMTLSPNIFDRLGSRVVVRRAEDGTANEVTMRAIMDRVSEHGVAMEVGGKSLRMFYGQDVDDTGEQAVAGKEESLALLLPEGPDYTTFLIPLEEVPTDGTVGEFQLRPGLNLTLRLQGGVLEAY